MLRDINQKPVDLAKTMQKLIVSDILVPMLRAKRADLLLVTMALESEMQACDVSSQHKDNPFWAAAVDTVMTSLACIKAILTGESSQGGAVQAVFDAKQGYQNTVGNALLQKYAREVRDYHATAAAEAAVKPEVEAAVSEMKTENSFIAASNAAKSLHKWRDTLRPGSQLKNRLGWKVVILLRWKTTVPSCKVEGFSRICSFSDKHVKRVMTPCRNVLSEKSP